MPVHVVDHPVITHKMNILRKKDTRTYKFRSLVNEITLLLTYEATRGLDVQDCEVTTPLTTFKSKTLRGSDVVICPIIRAGLGMVEGMLTVFPDARVAHVGLKRNEETAEPMFYYQNIPTDLEESTAIVVDPMLATGGSLSTAIGFVKEHKPHTIKAICLLAAPEGRDFIEREHPDVEVYVAAMDSHLNENKYIVPGLGDAGDRMFGTT